MIYVKILNNQVEVYPYSVQQLVNDNLNISFPDSISNELLEEYGVFSVIPTEPPTYDLIAQDLAELNPVLIDGVWVQQWEVVAATPEEIAQRQEKIIQSNKYTATKLLQETDWTAIPEVSSPEKSNPYLMNQNEFSEYRSTLRQIAVNPPITPAVFPDKPQEQWSN